jgi:hypothetical protein
MTENKASVISRKLDRLEPLSVDDETFLRDAVGDDTANFLLRSYDSRSEERAPLFERPASMCEHGAHMTGAETDRAYTNCRPCRLELVRKHWPKTPSFTINRIVAGKVEHIASATGESFEPFAQKVDFKTAEASPTFAILDFNYILRDLELAAGIFDGHACLDWEARLDALKRQIVGMREALDDKREVTERNT